MSRAFIGIIASALCSLATLACYHGVIQVPPVISPVWFVDDSGAPIVRALMLPRYSYDMSEVSSRIEHPFVQSSGQPLRFVLNKSWGAERGGVLYGKAVMLEDILVFAPGHGPVWLGSDFLYDKGERSISLKRLDVNEAVRTLSHLTDIMNHPRPYPKPSELWMTRNQPMVPDDARIEVYFTRAEKELVTQFLSEAWRQRP